MIQFSDDYNAKTIFEQVWEAPYPWFNKCPFDDHPKTEETLGFVHEISEDNEQIGWFEVTVPMIEKAVIDFYTQYLSKQTNANWSRSMANYLEDMDANDVDCILQLACFDEIRYS